MDKLWNDLPQGAPDIVRKGSTGSCPKQHLRPGIVRQLSLMETDKEEASGSEMWEPNFAGTPSRKIWMGFYIYPPFQEVVIGTDVSHLWPIRSNTMEHL